MLMDKAEKEKWSKKELKQVFTVFDKVTDQIASPYLTKVEMSVSGWKWLCLHLRVEVCNDQAQCIFLRGRVAGGRGKSCKQQLVSINCHVQMVYEADIDGDAQVCFEEFYDIMCEASL